MPPREFEFIRAAEILNCKPWELEDVPVRWMKAAFWMRQAERRADEIREKIEEARGESG